MSFSIIGTGSALPAFTIANGDFPASLNTSDEWIRTRTGIENRHILTKESLLSITQQAASSALADAGLVPGDIDYILCSTLGGDYLMPSLACTLAGALEMQCPALDINAACTGFLYGLDMAQGLFAAGRARRILVVAAEGISRIVDWTDRSTCVLFGDGAGAVVLEKGDSLAYLDIQCTPNTEVLCAPYPTGNHPESTSQTQPFIQMVGTEVYKYAVSAIVNGIQTALSQTGIAPEDIAGVFLHQANIRIIDTAIKQLPIPAEKYPTCIANTGNISAASIPVLLDAQAKAGALQKGQSIILCAFGAGLTAGTAIVRWDK